MMPPDAITCGENVTICLRRIDYEDFAKLDNGMRLAADDGGAIVSALMPDKEIKFGSQDKVSIFKVSISGRWISVLTQHFGQLRKNLGRDSSSLLPSRICCKSKVKFLFTEFNLIFPIWNFLPNNLRFVILQQNRYIANTFS
jgi:hypothetical protein